MAGNEERGDGEEVIGEIVVCVGSFIATVNHDPSASFREDEVHDVVAKSCKPVAVHDHNLRDHARECAFQKGTQPLPLEVDAGRDIFDDDVCRVRFFEVTDLPVEIWSLFCATDSGIDVSMLGCRITVDDGDPK